MTSSRTYLTKKTIFLVRLDEFFSLLLPTFIELLNSGAFALIFFDLLISLSQDLHRVY